MQLNYSSWKTELDQYIAALEDANTHLYILETFLPNWPAPSKVAVIQPSCWQPQINRVSLLQLFEAFTYDVVLEILLKQQDNNINGKST